ncbi:S8 family serine peptidase [Hamadaea tsunoensis]|uniref:S8 family serine peptidase n=1 Tax=Hamadaea tsunoensis TaxID=53368 RepID=UPI001FE15EB1|nr:S8 family serine peptidase [Hamadaea tsunoensis]
MRAHHAIGRPRRRRRIVVAGALALAVLVAATPASARPVPLSGGAEVVPDKAADVLATGRTYTVTLLTGDVVTVHTTSGGCPQVTVAPAAPGRVVSRTCLPNGHVRVVPAEAAGLIGKTLDPRLFDVTTLIQQKYDDANTTNLPVIVRQAAGAVAPLATALTGRRTLPSIHAVAGVMPKKSLAGRFAAQGSRGTGAGSLSAALTGASYVWLNERVRATGTTATSTVRAAAPAQPVAANLTQIGAPQAWQAGYTGRGQTVAVLDSGIDATHPDLVGKVVASENFSYSADTVDRFGHGTHVAATIAGTGAASGGVHRGVAPDASLLIGKVLDDNGEGDDSTVIAGMQWAAPLAGVVSMSLGSQLPSDGSDPMSQAVDALSAQYGTLFVIAAGNDGGSGEATIASPGAARSALTVGAVDGNDTLSGFSGRGPETGNAAPKPDITAPGVNVVSARAAGTALGTVLDAAYTTLSGTSMATPHVAGAAALLRQEHPDWSADQLKAALVDTAAPVHGGDLYDHGAGRLDAGAAVTAPVLGSSILDLGTLAYPQTGSTGSRITWTNTGSTPSTLGLSLTVTDRTGHAAPAGAVTLSSTSAAVPAGGHASTLVSIDETKLAGRPGLYEGILTARNSTTAIQIPLAFNVQPPTYTLTILTTAIPGTPAGALSSDAVIVNLDEPALFAEGVYNSDGASMTVAVPAGTYSVLGEVWDNTRTQTRDALTGASEVHVTGPATVVLDGANARPVTATVAGVATQQLEAGLAVVQTTRHGNIFWIEPWTGGSAPAVFSTPLSPVDIGTLNAYEVFSLRAPGTGPSPFVYQVAEDLHGGVPADPSYVIGAAEQARLARIDLTFHRLDYAGVTVGHQRFLQSPEGILIGDEYSEQVGATRTDYVSPGWPTLDEEFLGGDSPVAGLLTDAKRTTYQPGSHTSFDLLGQPLHPDWNDNTDPAAIGCVSATPKRTRGNLHIELQPLTDSHARYNCASRWWPPDAATLSLARNGQTIGSVNSLAADFTVPATAGSYALTLAEDATEVAPVSIRSSTTWTFRSTGPAGEGTAVLPLLSVDYGLPMDADDHPVGNRATFTVAQAAGVPAQSITGTRVWTSTDDGATWQPATVLPGAVSGTFAATLPTAASGTAVSLRVCVTGSAGSGVDQTIIRAYTVR